MHIKAFKNVCIFLYAANFIFELFFVLLTVYVFY